MRAKHFVLQQKQNVGQRFGTSKMHFSSPVNLAAVHSKVVFLSLLIGVDCYSHCGIL